MSQYPLANGTREENGEIRSPNLLLDLRTALD